MHERCPANPRSGVNSLQRVIPTALALGAAGSRARWQVRADHEGGESVAVDLEGEPAFGGAPVRQHELGAGGGVGHRDLGVLVAEVVQGGASSVPSNRASRQ
jgi:hypothetical protein